MGVIAIGHQIWAKIESLFASRDARRRNPKLNFIMLPKNI